MPGPDSTPWTDPTARPEAGRPPGRDSGSAPEGPHVPFPQEAGPPTTGRPLHGGEREYLLAVILTVLTLGVYHFYYHYKTHDELCAQLGRPNDIKPLFVAYVIVSVSLFVLPVAPLSIVGGLVLLGFIVVRQYAAIHDARQRLGLVRRGDATAFLLWDYLGSFILVGPFIAYYNMVHNYNDIWHALRHGAHLPTDAEVGDAPGAAAHLPAVAYRAESGDPGAWATGTSARPGGSGGDPAAYIGGAAGSVVSAAPVAPATTAEPGAAPRTPAAFSVRSRHGTDPPTEGHVSQSFMCPRCETHVAVDGAPGELIPVRCGACGEAGEVQVGT